jgi:hypothetical protein
MNDWLSQAAFVVEQAATAARFPEAATKGFDGDGWIWEWQKRYHDPVLKKDTIAQVVFRLRRDVFPPDMSIEILTSAWVPELPTNSWTRTHYSGNFDDLAKARLDSLLSAAWKRAGHAAENLNVVSKRREDALAILKGKEMIRM